MRITPGTGDFGKPFWFIRYASNELYKPAFGLHDNIVQIFSEQLKKIRCSVQFDQLLNQPVYQSTSNHLQIKPNGKMSAASCQAWKQLYQLPLIQSSIPPGVYKTRLMPLIGRLHQFIRSIQESQIFPNNCSTSILQPIPKKATKRFARITEVSVLLMSPQRLLSITF